MASGRVNELSMVSTPNVHIGGIPHLLSNFLRITQLCFITLPLMWNVASSEQNLRLHVQHYQANSCNTHTWLLVRVCELLLNPQVRKSVGGLGWAGYHHSLDEDDIHFSSDGSLSTAVRLTIVLNEPCPYKLLLDPTNFQVR
ncbi:hypothetical protein Trydic_g13995 [Trypoxylus dichotomus]